MVIFRLVPTTTAAIKPGDAVTFAGGMRKALVVGCIGGNNPDWFDVLVDQKAYEIALCHRDDLDPIAPGGISAPTRDLFVIKDIID
jgi:hypothetical protein